MSKINETNYPRRAQANYASTDMLVIQAAGGNTYTTRLEDMREDYKETLAPTLSALQDDVNENLATIEAGSTASKVYAKGDYLVFGGKLCRVTSTSIAAGATLTIGTNIELAPVGDELKTLSSDLANKGSGFPTVSHYDSARVINSYGQTYTATEDCWLNVFCKASGNKDLQLFVDGQIVVQISANTNDTYSATFPIKAGSQISSRNDSASGSYLVYKWAIK
jgi:hypothetical protein